MTNENVMVYTVKLARVKPDVIARYLKKEGLALDGALDEQVKRLVDATKQAVKDGVLPKDRLGKCDTCGGYSDMMHDECPYCGEAESEPSASKPQAGAAKAEKKAEKKADPEEATSTQEMQQVVTPVLQPEIEPPKIMRKQRSEADPIKSSKKAQPSKYSETDLNAAVATLAKAAIDTARGIYAYGKELQRINDLDLWKLRDNGKHVSFEAFCREEVKMSRQHAYRLMAVAKNYTEKQLEHYGLSKLHLALQVPEELRTKLLGDGSEGKRALSEKAKLIARGEERAKQPPPIDKSKAVTVAIVPGIVELPMMKRPTEADWPLDKPTDPATALQDDPWCRMQLTNNVVLTIRLTRNNKGEIIAIIEHRRRAESA